MHVVKDFSSSIVSNTVCCLTCTMKHLKLVAFNVVEVLSLSFERCVSFRSTIYSDFNAAFSALMSISRKLSS